MSLIPILTMTENDVGTESLKKDDNVTEKRRAHDVIWLIVFLLVQIGMIVVLIFTSKYGSIDRYDGLN